MLKDIQQFPMGLSIFQASPVLYAAPADKSWTPRSSRNKKISTV